MTLKRVIFGIEREIIPDIAFQMMASVIRLRETVFKFSNRLERFGIQEGDTVIDYGCGPGMYLAKAASLAGDTGTIYAVDIHPLAIQASERLVQKKRLTNVEAIQARGYDCPISTNTADLIYALDMFHMIEEPKVFLQELHRLLKPSGVLVIDDGHQPREETKRKVAACGLWSLVEETKDYLKYAPKVSSH